MLYLQYIVTFELVYIFHSLYISSWLDANLSIKVKYFTILWLLYTFTQLIKC